MISSPTTLFWRDVKSLPVQAAVLTRPRWQRPLEVTLGGLQAELVFISALGESAVDEADLAVVITVDS